MHRSIVEMKPKEIVPNPKEKTNTSTMFCSFVSHKKKILNIFSLLLFLFL